MAEGLSHHFVDRLAATGACCTLPIRGFFMLIEQQIAERLDRAAAAAIKNWDGLWGDPMAITRLSRPAAGPTASRFAA